jgi:hypothetical protein
MVDKWALYIGNAAKVRKEVGRLVKRKRDFEKISNDLPFFQTANSLVLK